jgi:hypothetical protein
MTKRWYCGCASVLAVLGIVACAKTIGGTFAKTQDYAPKARTSENVALVLKGDPSPTCSLRRVGLARYSGNKRNAMGGGSDATDAESLEGLRTYLAGLGVDGALDVRCGATGTTGNGECEGTAFICDDKP